MSLRLFFASALAFAILTTGSRVLAAPAEGGKRKIHFEWEEIPDSISYEIEITRVLPDGTRKKPMKFESTKTEWSGEIRPGRYEMRLRSVDDRRVRGDWNEPTELLVQVPPPQTMSPTDKSEIKTQKEEKFEVTFQWSPVPLASGYLLEILSEGGEVLEKRETAKTKESVSLAVARSYRWRVTSQFENKSDLGEVSPVQPQFSLVGAELDPVELERPQSKFVNEVTWKGPALAETYSFALKKRLPNGQWKNVQRETEAKEPRVMLNPKEPGGKYRLIVKAQARGREPSRAESLDFDLYEGERTPAAIETAMLKDSMEKSLNNYWIASYLISNLSYQGSNKETGTKLNYDVLGGTGRVGYGYMPQSQWGFVTMLDYSGVVINSQNYTYGSLEAQAVWKTYLWRATQFRAYFGGVLRETPEAKGFNSDNVEVKNIVDLGPSLGFQFWQPVSLKMGLQFNGQVSTSFFKVSTPNNEDVLPSQSFQLGVLGSYKFRDNVTGLAGYAYRAVNANYKATPYSGGGEANFAQAGDINKVSLTGHFLNLYLEWGF